MSPSASRPWEISAYGGVCIIAIAMVIVTLGFISSHCEWVAATTGISGACDLGTGWILVALAFLAIAAYSGWQLYDLLRKRA